NVQDGLVMANINNVDCIVAVGGGSVIDTAKAISIIMTNPEFNDVVSLDGVANTQNKGLPLFALPTTAGTAAEVTINYVITDETRTKKMVCVDVHDIPVCAIIDPDLMDGMPPMLAASTGMDALTHAMEGYITKAGWLIPDMFHVNAMALIYKNLEKAAMKKDKVAIEKMAYAQYIAGMGFSNVGLGIVHSMAHSLGAYFDTPHGIANALLLPHVMRFNGQVCPQLFRNMANAMGIDITDTTDQEAIDRVVMAIKNLSVSLGIPQTLREIGIPEEMIPTLANQAINDACTPGNPRKVTVEDIINLYKEAY
ncbi:MAG: iron-containing alcohol dehydrogenase, partial [Bacilli bacterium]|nr:iron-containing alcohol dehydrogenase [Bacilli bacterium]